jgi:hypothetical protein
MLDGDRPIVALTLKITTVALPLLDLSAFFQANH